ncbi:hypothetical protein VE03_04390 [Pseudogymnoascus sp. 23342-1-I1]|nr:hypothetical protein VE03_04390 [Pseudogymnoascus sp. 23342-1-I1]
MKISFRACGLVLLTVAADVTSAVKVDVHDIESIKAAASKVAYGLAKFYTGNVTNTPETIGILGRPYYWWEGGAMWGAFLDYYRLTGDASYNEIAYQALVSQVGPNHDYMVPMYNKEEGNDDQAFWGFATMSAAEQDWRAPPSPIPSWLQLTINLWNTQAARWDTLHCGGGLRWQIFEYNNGYTYKNSVTNGAFFQLSARLARYTGNATYADWAGRVWDWTRESGLIDDRFNVYDGAGIESNCVDINYIQFSYSPGIYLYGAATMYNATAGSSLWRERTQGLLVRTNEWFFTPFPNATDVMYEVPCERLGTCNYDMLSFKAYLSRFMWATSKIAPFTAPAIGRVLRASAAGAAAACDGSETGELCGQKWYTGTSEGVFGPGQQMAALEVLQGLLTPEADAPLTAKGGKLVGSALPSRAAVGGEAAVAEVPEAKAVEVPAVSATGGGERRGVGWGVLGVGGAAVVVAMFL